MRGRWPNQAILLGGALSLIIPFGALAQDRAGADDRGGMDAQLAFSQGLSVSDQGGSRGVTGLGFVLTSETRTQIFGFEANGDLFQAFDDGLETGIERGRVALSYSIESRDMALTTGATYRLADLDDIVVDPDLPVGQVFVDGGSSERIGADLRLEIGRDARFGATFSAGFAQLRYADIGAQDLSDETKISANLDLRFEIDPRIVTALSFDTARTERDTAQDVDSQRVRAAVDFAVTPTLDATVSIGHRTVTTTDMRVSDRSEGLTYRLAVTQERPIGALTASLVSDVSETGRRSTLTAGGRFELARGASFEVEAGLTEGRDGVARPLVSLRYQDSLPTLSYAVSARQAISVDADSEEVLNSQVRLDLDYELTPVSRLGSDLTYQETDVLGTGNDRYRLIVGLEYRHQLNADWSFLTRITHTQSREDGSVLERENELFLGFDTAIAWRP